MGSWKGIRLNCYKDPRAVKLYDLENDLAEEQNVAEQHPEIVRKMDRLLRRATQRFGDLGLPQRASEAACQTCQGLTWHSVGVHALPCRRRHAEAWTPTYPEEADHEKRLHIVRLDRVLPAGLGRGNGRAARAARSVHLGYPAPDAVLFYNEMTVLESTPGSYFMAAGWNTGYFGIQELDNGRKVILFSVWDPTKGDDPSAVKQEERVECLHTPDVRIRRFGGEGTGGQCMGSFDWKIGETHRFAVTAVADARRRPTRVTSG